jgi:hypothetical protein
MNPTFNISTAGATASHWITRLLNSHKDIVCLHGFREQPFQTNPEPLDLETYFVGLRKLREITLDTKVFGTVHSFNGISAKKYVIAAGGAHKFIIRDPFTRLHSLFTVYYPELLGEKLSAGQDIYTLIRERKQVQDMDQYSLENLTNVEHRFYSLCHQVIIADYKNIREGSTEDCIRHEEFVTSPDYALHHLVELLGGEKEFLEREISARLHKKKASHSVVPPMSSEEIFLLWPDTFKMIFATQMSVLETEVKDGINYYESCGYSFPPSFYQWASTFEGQVG